MRLIRGDFLTEPVEERFGLVFAVFNMLMSFSTQAEQIRALRAWADVRAVAATAAEDRDDNEHPGPAAEGPAPGRAEK